jgi:hypothetical protein
MTTTRLKPRPMKKVSKTPKANPVNDSQSGTWIPLRVAAQRFVLQPDKGSVTFARLAVLTVLQHAILNREIIARPYVKQHELGLAILDPDKSTVGEASFTHWLARIRADPDILLMSSAMDPRSGDLETLNRRIYDLEWQVKGTGSHWKAKKAQVLQIALRMVIEDIGKYKDAKGQFRATRLAGEIEDMRDVLGLKPDEPTVGTITEYIREALRESKVVVSTEE